MAEKRPEVHIECSDEVESLLKRFHPQFGNQNHLQITALYREVVKLRKLVQEGSNRKKEISNINRANRTRLKEIKQKESNLVYLLSKEVTTMR